MAKEDAKIIIGGDAQRAVKSLQDVSKNLGGLGNSVNSFLGQATGFLNWQTAAAAGATALVGVLGAAIKSQIDYADKMQNMSMRTGIAVESLSKLAYVAQQSDTSVETLQKSMKFLNTSIYDVSKGNTNAIDKFKEFGIQIYNVDGTVKSAEQTLIAAADAYVKLDSEAAKTALAVQLFGKAGQELMPMLAEGGAGIKALTDEAEKLGLKIDSKTAIAAERFNDNLDKLAAFGKGAVNVLVEELTPALDSFSNAVDNSNTSVDSWTEKLRKAFSFVTDLAKYTTPGLGVGNSILKLDPAGNYVTGDEADKAWKDYYSKQGAGFKLNYNPALGMTIDTGFNPLNIKAIDPTKKNYGGSGGSGGGSRGSTGDNGLDAWLMQYDNFAATRTMSMNPSLLMQGGSGIPFQDDPELLGLSQTLDAQLAFIDESKSAYYDYFSDVQVGFMDHMNALGSDYSQSLGGIASMFEAFANTSAEQQGILFDISKAFRAAEIITSTWSSAQKAYEWGMTAGGPIAAGIFMASAIATGIGNLNSMLSTQPGQSSISGGGTAPVPNFAQRNPQGGNSGGGTKNINITFEGFIWDKDRLAREIVPAINRAISDGVGR